MYTCDCCHGAAHRPGVVGRRLFGAGLAGLAATAMAAPQAWAAGDEFRTRMTPAQALQALRDGNARHVRQNTAPPNTDRRRRTQTARGQGPFATFVSCADSRVPVEILFNRGLGELFVTRTAGNVADPVVVGSIEYSVAVLGAPLLVVMGHERCGAVVAATEAVTRNATFPGSIMSLVTPIMPAVRAVQGRPGDLVENSVRENALMTARRMATDSPILSAAVREGRLMVVAARYDLDDGRVEFMTLTS